VIKALFKNQWLKYHKEQDLVKMRGCRGRDHMVVGFTTTCAISAYHH